MKALATTVAILLIGLALGGQACKQEPSGTDDPTMTPEMEEMVRSEVARQLAQERARLSAPPREMPRPTPPVPPPIPRPPVPPPVPPPVEPPSAPPVEPPSAPAELPGDSPTMQPGPADASLSVLDLQTASAVDRKERVPVGISSAFHKDHGEVWAYAVLENEGETERQVAFVWKHGGEEHGRSSLEVGAKAAQWRTWARKRVPTPGRWVVELQDEAGLTLASRSFEVE